MSNPSDSSRNVGYGNPPVEHRFRPGQSGNPRGRRKGSKNRPKLDDLEPLRRFVELEANRSIKVREGERVIAVPIMQAIARKFVRSGLGDNLSAQKMVLDTLSKMQRERAEQRLGAVQAAIEYKNLWERKFEERRLTGQKGPEPMPHPDHIEVDLDAGIVTFNGPRNWEEKRYWDQYKELLGGLADDIQYLERQLKRKKDDPYLTKELERSTRRRQHYIDKLPSAVRGYFLGDE
jgi:hypothetical protein